MNIPELKRKFDAMVKKMKVNPDKGSSSIKNEWKTLMPDERKILRPFFTKQLWFELAKTIEATEAQFYWVELCNELSDESTEEGPIQPLYLSDNIKDIQVAKHFYDLRKNKVLENTNEELAKALSQIFGLNLKTMLSYINEPRRLSKAQPLLK